ncbi:valine--tRNA ligase [soil metagenome]
MPAELPKTFDPKAAQEKWLTLWESKGYFHSVPDAAKTPYTIVIPPPNVTGALHMGHALNNTLQDVLIRWKRMQGFNALWMPGTDHAGIATQAVVERLLKAEDKNFNRNEYGREKLVEKIWEWKEKYEKRILGQLRELGSSCDWDRTRFTLDDQCARAVRETFFRMFKDGYIYRGKRLVNWDCQLQTSVADDETENIKQKGKFYYFRYQVISGPADALPFVLIATTRPETMLGDTCVAVHPEPARELDKRQKELEKELASADEKKAKEIREHLERLKTRREETLPHLEKLAAMAAAGTMLELPLVGRKIPLIADRYADPEKGTGAVKITPAHDFNDYEVGQRHPEIGPPINILNPDGSINDIGKGTFRSTDYTYVGLDRFKAREAVIADMTALELFEKEEEVDNTIPISDRSKTPIEPYLSDQWFVKMADRDDGLPGLAQMAMEAVTDNRVTFFPDRYAKSYLDWLGEKRDWCISRQLWWGHRILVWSRTFGDKAHYLDECAEALPQSPLAHCPSQLDDNTQTIHVCLQSFPDKEQEYYLATSGYTQSEDVLDTWFSSALWPHSTLGWPEQTAELQYYYPTNTLVTSRDIITLWVARMVLTGLYNLDEIPFKHVFITPKVLDGFGETMSKTKGNGVDPLDIIELYGTDALRFGMVSLATETQDSRLPVVNVCPHCGAQVPVKQEHMYMRTKKLACPACKKSFRPGGPWPSDDPELLTAKQGSDRFEQGRNFANKLWNATRFILMNLEGYTPAPLEVKALAVEDRWILSRLATTANAVTAALEAYKFSEVSKLLYDFAWNEFCDWYIEMSKARRSDAVCQRVLVNVLDGILRLIQPVMPFVAESLWEALAEVAPSRGIGHLEPAAANACIATWPTYPESQIDVGTETSIARMQELVRGIREIRNRYSIDKDPLAVAVKCDESIAAALKPLTPFINSLGQLKSFDCGPAVTKPKQAGSFVNVEFEAYVALEGLIDPAAEAVRLTKQIAEKVKLRDATMAKLSNESFVARAKEEVVAQQRELVVDLAKQIAAMEANLSELKSA